MKHFRLITLLLGVSAAYACSRQGEGDACFVSNGNGDCDSGLVCTPAKKLAEHTKLDLSGSATDRCCPADGKSTNSHCKLATDVDATTETGGAGGAADTVGGATAAGGSSAASSTAASAGASTAEGGSGTGASSTGTGGAGTGGSSTGT